MIPLATPETLILEPPEKDWGVPEQEVPMMERGMQSLVSKMLFLLLTGLLSSIIFLFVNVIFRLGVDMQPLLNVATFIALPSMAVLFMIYGITFERCEGNRERKIRDLSNDRMVEWEESILIPYINEVYGVSVLKIFPNLQEALVSKDGEEFRVRFNGLTYDRRTVFISSVSKIPSYNITLSPEGLTLDRHMVLPLERIDK